MGRKRTLAYGEVSNSDHGLQQQVDFTAHGLPHHPGYALAQQQHYREHPNYTQFVEEDNCRHKRPPRVSKPLVDLSEYDSFCISPAHTCLLFHLPCEILNAQGHGAAAMAESLQLSLTDITDISQETGAVDMYSQLPLPKSRSRHACGNNGLDHGLVSQVDHEPTSCEQKLMDCKLKIMASRLKYGADVWALAAQLVNPYETVPSIAARVLNRAFFKMWELMQLFPGLVPSMAKQPRLLSAHLCEGPGGFVQAVHMYRMQSVESEKGLNGSPSSVIDYCPGKKGSGDAWFAITLATPSGQGDSLKMKMSKLQECSSEFVQGHIHYGADQSGDITNPNNISSFVQYVLQKSDGEKMHLITGDGAFDVSDDFSLQEQSHSHLFFCEILIAARLQCPGGALVLKFFDCFTKDTVTLLRILTSLYTTVDIVRLRTSRVCNSERFVVAQGFRSLPGSVEDKLMSISAAWYQFVRDGALATINISKPCPASFLEALNQGTAAIASKQILFILQAVDVAEDLGKRLSTINVSQHKGILSILRRKLKTVEKMQINALSLCETLNIPLANFRT